MKIKFVLFAVTMLVTACSRVHEEKVFNINVNEKQVYNVRFKDENGNYLFSEFSKYLLKKKVVDKSITVSLLKSNDTISLNLSNHRPILSTAEIHAHMNYNGFEIFFFDNYIQNPIYSLSNTIVDSSSIKFDPDTISDIKRYFGSRSDIRSNVLIVGQKIVEYWPPYPIDHARKEIIPCSRKN